MKGFFGKGEFSRGGPVLNEIKQVEELEDCSMNISATLSNERYINRLKWIDLKQNKQLENDFDSKFKSEFVNFKLTTDKNFETKFFKVNFTDHIPLDEEINSDKLIKTSNNTAMKNANNQVLFVFAPFLNPKKIKPIMM